MKGYELVEALHRNFGVRGTAGSRVMVKDKVTGTIFSVKGVVLDNHDDADGSTTHWIEVEEY